MSIKPFISWLTLNSALIGVQWLPCIFCIVAKTGPVLDTDGDGAIRFKALKEEATRMKLITRMEDLHKLNQSRSDELGFMKYEILEFEANADHLKRVVELLTELKPSQCLYSGKNIEGDTRSRMKRLAKDKRRNSSISRDIYTSTALPWQPSWMTASLKD